MKTNNYKLNLLRNGIVLKKIFTILMMVVATTFFAKAQSVEVEPNQTILQIASNTFSAGSTASIAAHIGNSPDSVDFFKITLPHCGTWEFNINNPNGTSCNIHLTFFNAPNIITGKIKETDFDFAIGLPEPIAFNCGQTIYVKVEQTSGSNLGAYDLQISENTFNGWVCNNSFVSAQPVPVNTSFNGRLYGYDCDGGNDVDYYKVTPTQCGVFNLGITGINSSQHLIVDFYDSTYSLTTSIASTNGETCAGGDVLPYGVLMSGGAYYFKIYENVSYNCGGAGYTYSLVDDPFTVTLSYDISDVAECNNTFETAFPVPVNSTFPAKLWGSNNIISNTSNNFDIDQDQDFFVVHPTQCGVLNLGIIGINSLQHLMVDFFDSTYSLTTPIATTSGITCNGGDVDTFGVLMSAGTYYFRIYENVSYNCGGAAYTYSLVNDPFTVTLSYDVSDVAECNNTFETAFPVPVNSTFPAKLWGSNNIISNTSNNFDIDQDQDFFVVHPTQCGVLNLGIIGINSLQHLIVDFFDSTYSLTTPIATTSGISCNGGDVNTFGVLMSAGTYYFRIYENVSYNCGGAAYTYSLVNDPFTVSLSFTPSLITPTISGSSSITVANGTPVTLVSSSAQHNSWSVNGTLSGTNDTLTFTSTQSGYVTLQLDSAGCGSGIDSVYIDVTTGIASLDYNAHITLYPNPAQTQLTINTNGTAVEQINIYNATGSLVMAAATMVGGQLSIVNLANGIYFLEVKTAQGVGRKRFVKM